MRDFFSSKKPGNSFLLWQGKEKSHSISKCLLPVLTIFYTLMQETSAAVQLPRTSAMDHHKPIKILWIPEEGATIKPICTEQLGRFIICLCLILSKPHANSNAPQNWSWQHRPLVSSAELRTCLHPWGSYSIWQRPLQLSLAIPQDCSYCMGGGLTKKLEHNSLWSFKQICSFVHLLPFSPIYVAVCC